MTPSAVANSGLMSSSAIGLPAIKSPTATTAAAKASVSATSRPRYPDSNSAACSSSIADRASARSIGAIRWLLSPKSPVNTPPSPASTTGPNEGSRTPPTITSVPRSTGAAASISTSAVIPRSSAAARMAVAAPRTASGASSPTATPTPSAHSLLRVTAGAENFATTG